MKTIKNISILLMLSIAVLAMTSCGGSDNAEATREDKAGFDSETNEIIEIGGYSFEIPDYYVLNEELTGETSRNYKIADGEAVVHFATDDKTAGNKEEFDSNYDEYVEGIISGISEDAKADGNDFTYEVNGNPCSGRVELLYNEPAHTLVAVAFMQRNASASDYLPDFNRVIDSAKLVVSMPKDEPKQSDPDSSLLSPEFKKTMDDYEAWFDHYCDVMKKYKEDSTNLELLSEMTSLLSEETTMLQQMENMNQSEMNTAELAYYLEVTARIEKKLLEVTY